MRVHLILDLTRDETPGRTPTADVLAELESELEANALEVDGVVYELQVVGVGKTLKEAADSLKLRTAHRKS